VASNQRMVGRPPIITITTVAAVTVAAVTGAKVLGPIATVTAAKAAATTAVTSPTVIGSIKVVTMRVIWVVVVAQVDRRTTVLCFNVTTVASVALKIY
jgi:hypothetical protein